MKSFEKKLTASYPIGDIQNGKFIKLKREYIMQNWKIYVKFF